MLDLAFDGGRVSGTVALPNGLPGVFRWNGEDVPLAEGRSHNIDLSPRK